MAENILIVGGSRGLGLELVKHYTSVDGKANKVFTTVRSSTPNLPSNVHSIEGIDLSNQDCAPKILQGLKDNKVENLDKLYITAGLLQPENFDELKWQGQIDMYFYSHSLLGYRD